MCSNVPRHTCLCVKIYLYMSLWRPENITVIVQVTNTLSSSLKECFTSQAFDNYPRLVNKPEKATCFHCLALGLQMHAATPCLFKKVVSRDSTQVITLRRQALYPVSYHTGWQAMCFTRCILQCILVGPVQPGSFYHALSVSNTVFELLVEISYYKTIHPMMTE